jgi:hypothetical protein
MLNLLHFSKSAIALTDASYFFKNYCHTAFPQVVLVSSPQKFAQPLYLFQL